MQKRSYPVSQIIINSKVKIFLKWLLFQLGLFEIMRLGSFWKGKKFVNLNYFFEHFPVGSFPEGSAFELQEVAEVWAFLLFPEF